MKPHSASILSNADEMQKNRLSDGDKERSQVME